MGLTELKKRMEKAGELELPHREEIRINKTGKLKTSPRADDDATGMKPIEINLDNLDAKMVEQQHPDLEHLPRDTVKKMIMTVPLDQEFIFKVAVDCGENYVQAMRQVLSRTRKKARKRKVRLDEFKLLTRKIINRPAAEPPHDEVTLIRSKNMSALEVSVYDEILEQFERK